MEQDHVSTLSGVHKGGFRVTAHAVLRLRGSDTLDFLHRMSTNDLLGLTPGKVRTTVFTNEKGRIVDLVDVLHFGSSLLLVAGERSANALAGWLNKFIIMEDITIDDLAGTVQVIDFLVPSPRASDGEISRFTEENGRLITRYSPPLWGGLIMRDIVLPPPAPDRAPGEDTSPSQLRTQDEIDPSEFQQWRIERGVPAVGSELTEKYNPLEARLERFVSFTKGCYIGQEVIARIDSYNKLQRRLLQLEISEVDGNTSHAPIRLLAGSAEAGDVTSWAYSERQKRYLALAYIHVDMEEADLSLSCACGRTHPVKVSSRDGHAQ